MVTIDKLTASGDTAVAEITSRGTMVMKNGKGAEGHKKEKKVRAGAAVS